MSHDNRDGIWIGTHSLLVPSHCKAFEQNDDSIDAPNARPSTTVLRNASRLIGRSISGIAWTEMASRKYHRREKARAKAEFQEESRLRS